MVDQPTSQHEDGPEAARASASLPASGPASASASGAGAPSAPVSAEPPPVAGPQYGRLSDAQADAVARLVVQGRPLSLIAMAVGRAPEALRRMIGGSLRSRIEEVRAQVMRETSAHWFEMLAMLPQARANMQTALLSNDEKIRLATSQWIHEQLVPRPTQTHEVEHNVHFGEEVTGLLEAMNRQLSEVRDAQGGRDPLARVRTGADALSRPVLVLPSNSEPDDAA